MALNTGDNSTIKNIKKSGSEICAMRVVHPVSCLMTPIHGFTFLILTETLIKTMYFTWSTGWTGSNPSEHVQQGLTLQTLNWMSGPHHHLNL